MEINLSDNFSFLRKASKMNLTDFAKILGKGKSSVDNYEKGKSEPPASVVHKIVQHFGIPFSDFMEMKLEDHMEADLASIKSYYDNKVDNTGRNKNDNIGEKDTFPQKNVSMLSSAQTVIKPVLVTVDSQHRENVTFVPVKAQAGYLTGYADPVYMEALPAFSFPGFTNGLFRAFEVKGHSMLQVDGKGFHPGDITINQYVEQTKDIIDGRVYIVVTTEGVILKRCINRLDSDLPKLICKSDNLSHDYPDIVLDPEEIIEVWEFKRNFSAQAPPPGDLFKVINDLSARVALLEDEKRKSLKDNPSA